MTHRAVVGALLGCLVMGGCSEGGADPTSPSSMELRDTSGPLIASSGEGATMGPRLKPDEEQKTWTFGTVLCSDDPGADVVIDDVHFVVAPEGGGSGASREPEVEQLFRVIPPWGGKPDRADLPVVSLDGRPEGSLNGEIGAQPPDEPIDYPCKHQVSPDRDYPLIELLTVVTVGPGGGVVRETHVEYHVGARDYTLEIAWQVGICGPDVPDDLECPDRGDRTGA
jgi:hypothetical protein